MEVYRETTSDYILYGNKTSIHNLFNVLSYLHKNLLSK